MAYYSEVRNKFIVGQFVLVVPETEEVSRAVLRGEFKDVLLELEALNSLLAKAGDS